MKKSEQIKILQELLKAKDAEIAELKRQLIAKINPPLPVWTEPFTWPPRQPWKIDDTGMLRVNPGQITYMTGDGGNWVPC